ncbi:hypothetical protein ACJ72_03934 [Emergomyces africanus]|uniref:Uncharacterized protein n=1 Tax=Emergomyces africanus TaxID=1955775 RepID=A0A1B7NY62_9EURO|nr:hypothetical protein ACJ72_03934 [Emergomyces africanus]
MLAVDIAMRTEAPCAIPAVRLSTTAALSTKLNTAANTGRPAARSPKHALLSRSRIACRTSGVGTVQMQFDHAADMLRLCQRDGIGIRDAIPGAMLRLGMDQDALRYEGLGEVRYHYHSLQSPSQLDNRE